MDMGTLWGDLQRAFGFEESSPTRSLTLVIQALFIIIVTGWLANWCRQRIRRAAKAGRTYADAASVLSRVVAFSIYALGVALLLGVLGVNSTAIAAVLGAATIGGTLALQDVARAFVNGIYILVERPYRIGDKIRIGATEGRVEEIGVRLTRLHTEGGNHIIVPNTLVFTSIVENASTGRLERQQFTVSGIERSVTAIKDAVALTLKGAAHLTHHEPTIEILQTGPEGTTAEITVEYDHGHLINDLVMSQLRDEFPEATITAKLAATSP